LSTSAALSCRSSLISNNWLADGDSNSAFFHKSIKSHNQRSRIEVINTVDNVEVTRTFFLEVFVAHYEAFLGTSTVCDDLDTTSLFLKTVRMAAHRLSLKKGWDVVGQDVCMAVHDFFTNGQLFKEVNHTFLSLIPKVVTTLLNVSDYCPISCCNVLYKCISKILTNRIIEGIKEELMHNYQRNRGPPRYAFKVDIQKAYDTVNWQFLGFILKCFGFHHTMIKWIMACVKSPSFFICINGDIHGFFKGKRGLRQVDPLFPYLFTLVMEVLTSIFQRRVRLSESFRYLKHCEELQIINVCFANELFLFARGDVESASVIMESLNEFKQVTGLVPSIPKSTTFFCNVMNHVKISILNVMPFSEGRLQLCNSVISSMQVYWASVLAIPFGITEDIQQLIRGFLWCNGEYKRGKAKVAWDDICLPKCEGGLGVRCLKMQVGNGLRTSLWYDTWCNQSPLSNFISRRDIAREGHHLRMCVADIISNGDWEWPQAWLQKALNLGLIPAPMLSDREDCMRWRDGNGNMTIFR
ncbi:protein LAZ1, partial [Tanacetum coccineum]